MSISPRFKTLISVAALALLAAQPFAALAQIAPDASSAYNTFGGKPGLLKINTDLVTRAKADARLAAAFKDANTQRLAEQLTEQFCQVLGGPCSYRGPDMKTAHQNMDVTANQFNALVELLQDAMKAQNVPFGAQNALLAKLAPMHRDIIAR
jgi:hemoglobin